MASARALKAAQPAFPLILGTDFSGFLLLSAITIASTRCEVYGHGPSRRPRRQWPCANTSVREPNALKPTGLITSMRSPDVAAHCLEFWLKVGPNAEPFQSFDSTVPRQGDGSVNGLEWWAILAVSVANGKGRVISLAS